MARKGGYRNDDQRKAIFANLNMKGNCPPASREAQKAWGELPSPVKGILGKILPDRDRDKVPNLFDCQPCNPLKQDSFSKEDQEFLDHLPDIVDTGNYIDEGSFGAVYELEGNPDFVIKVPHSDWNDSVVKKEWEKYQKYNLEKYSLMIPTALRWIYNEYADIMIPVLVRPKLTPLEGYAHTKEMFSNELLEEMRLGVLEFAKDGIYLEDGFQIGITANGKAYIYDLDSVRKGSETSKFSPMEEDDFHWRVFLRLIGKEREILGLETEKRIQEFIDACKKSKNGLKNADGLEIISKKPFIAIGNIADPDVFKKFQRVSHSGELWERMFPEFRLYYQKQGIPMPEELKKYIEMAEATIKEKNGT